MPDGSGTQSQDNAWKRWWMMIIRFGKCQLWLRGLRDWGFCFSVHMWSFLLTRCSCLHQPRIQQFVYGIIRAQNASRRIRGMSTERIVFRHALSQPRENMLLAGARTIRFTSGICSLGRSCRSYKDIVVSQCLQLSGTIILRRLGRCCSSLGCEWHYLVPCRPHGLIPCSRLTHLEA